MRALLVVVLLGACYAPTYEGVACSASGGCPAGYACAANNLCTASEAEPEPEPDSGSLPDAAPGSLDASAPPDAGPLDETPPVTTITAQPPAFDAETRPLLTFASSEPGSTFVCRVDTLAFAPCDGSFEPAPLADGEHVFEVSATDPAGNQESPPAYVRWTVDTTPPTVTIAAGPPSVSGTTVVFNFSADEPATAYECSADWVSGGAFVACTPPAVYATVPNGAHSFRARATDRADLVGPPSASYLWTVDSTAFSTSITAGPGPVSGKNVSFTFDSTRAGSTYECSLDPVGSPVFADCTSPIAFTNLLEGQHTLHVRAENPVGTYATPALQIWSVDRTGPATTIGATGIPVRDGYSRAANLTFSLSCNESVCTYECKLDAGSWVALAGADCPLTSLDDGMHHLHTRATDAWSNVGGESDWTWTTDRTLPTVTLTGVPTCNSAGSLPIDYLVTDGYGVASRRCKLTRTSGGQTTVVSDAACASTSSYTASGLVAPSSYTFSITGTDNAGNSRTVSGSWLQRSAIQCGEL